MHRALAVTFVLLAVNMASIDKLSAQTSQTNEAKQAKKIEDKIRKMDRGERKAIKVTLRNDDVRRGHVADVRDDYFVLVDRTGTQTSIKYTEVAKIGDRGLSTGMKIFIGAIVVAAIMGAIGNGKD